MNADELIENAAGMFDTPVLAILARCEESGVHLRVDDGHLKAKGDMVSIAAWKGMIQRHKPEIIAELTGQVITNDDLGELATLAADYAELTARIVELCQIVGYSDEARNRMLEARRNLYPVQYSTECAYFLLQVMRARAGGYLDKADRGKKHHAS